MDTMFKLSDLSHHNKVRYHKSSQIIELVKTKWNKLHQETSIFRYKIGNLQEKILDGKYLLQLNPDRSCKRRMPEQVDDMSQPYDGNKFNFTKVLPPEVMFNLVKEGDESEIHALLVNVSPISRYHTLFCPSINQGLSQVVTEESLELVLEIMFLSPDRALRIGYNSLCALASVNHLHYHIFQESNILPVETVKCKQLKGQLYCLENYPAPAFCFELANRDNIKMKTKAIYKMIVHFLKNSIAHNIFITRGSSVVAGGTKEVVRAIVWPRKSSSGAKQLTAFNVAVCELAGWFTVSNKHDYENLTTEELEQELKRWAIDNFEELSKVLMLLY